MFLTNLFHNSTATCFGILGRCRNDEFGKISSKRYTPFTRSSRHRANVEQAWWNPAPGSNVGLGLAHSWSRVIFSFQLQPARPPN